MSLALFASRLSVRFLPPQVLLARGSSAGIHCSTFCNTRHDAHKKVDDVKVKLHPIGGDRKDMDRTALERFSEKEGIYPGLAYEVFNKRRGRPLAPFLSAYKMHFTMALSLMHRVTGAIYSSAFYLAAFYLATLAPPFPEVVEWIRDLHLNPYFLVGLKFILSWGVCYHMFNGIRHLAWDLGSGFGSMEAAHVTGSGFGSRKVVHRTGAAVLIATTVAAVYLSML